MAGIRRVWVFTVTSTASHAGTNARLQLEITCRNGEMVSGELRHHRGNDLDGGQEGSFSMCLSEADSIDDTNVEQIRLRIEGTDAWLPRSISVTSENVDGGIVVLSDEPHWDRWFDPEFTPGFALRLLPRSQETGSRELLASRSQVQQ
jgi:hypothetical protein